MSVTINCSNIINWTWILIYLSIQWWSLIRSVVFTLVGAVEHFAHPLCAGQSAKIQWMGGERGDPEG